MTILETFIKLRDDLKLWVTNNLNTKANKDHTHDEISELESLVGSTSVSDQISEAISNIENVIQEPLIGTTQEITPTQVYEAVMSGRNVIITHIVDDYVYGNFTNFITVPDIIVHSSVTSINVDNTTRHVCLSGILDENIWEIKENEIGIDTTLTQEGKVADAKAVGDRFKELDGFSVMGQSVMVPDSVQSDDLLKVVTKINPVQYGEGDPSLNNPRTIYKTRKIVMLNPDDDNVNLFYIDRSSGSHGGIKYTVNDDGSITANGTATSTSEFYFCSGVFLKEGVKYKITGIPEDQLSSGETTYKIDDYYPDLPSSLRIGNVFKVAGKEFTGDGYTHAFRIRVNKGTLMNSVVFRPMLFIVKDGESDPEFSAFKGKAHVASTPEGSHIVGGDYDWNTGYLHNGLMSLTLDGSDDESWCFAEEGGSLVDPPEVCSFYVTLPNYPSPASSSQDGLCSRFIVDKVDTPVGISPGHCRFGIKRGTFYPHYSTSSKDTSIVCVFCVSREELASLVPEGDVLGLPYLMQYLKNNPIQIAYPTESFVVSNCENICREGRQFFVNVDSVTTICETDIDSSISIPGKAPDAAVLKQYHNYLSQGSHSEYNITKGNGWYRVGLFIRGSSGLAEFCLYNLKSDYGKLYQSLIIGFSGFTNIVGSGATYPRDTEARPRIFQILNHHFGENVLVSGTANRAILVDKVRISYPKLADDTYASSSYTNPINCYLDLHITGGPDGEWDWGGVGLETNLLAPTNHYRCEPIVEETPCAVDSSGNIIGHFSEICDSFEMTLRDSQGFYVPDDSEFTNLIAERVRSSSLETKKVSSDIGVVNNLYTKSGLELVYVGDELTMLDSGCRYNINYFEIFGGSFTEGSECFLRLRGDNLLFNENRSGAYLENMGKYGAPEGYACTSNKSTNVKYKIYDNGIYRLMGSVKGETAFTISDCRNQPIILKAGKSYQIKDCWVKMIPRSTYDEKYRGNFGDIPSTEAGYRSISSYPYKGQSGSTGTPKQNVQSTGVLAQDMVIYYAGFYFKGGSAAFDYTDVLMYPQVCEEGLIVQIPAKFYANDPIFPEMISTRELAYSPDPISLGALTGDSISFNFTDKSLTFGDTGNFYGDSNKLFSISFDHIRSLHRYITNVVPSFEPSMFNCTTYTRSPKIFSGYNDPTEYASDFGEVGDIYIVIEE